MFYALVACATIVFHFPIIIILSLPRLVDRAAQEGIEVGQINVTPVA